MRLVGKNVVVTGSSGIAAAGARLAASQGASVDALKDRTGAIIDLTKLGIVEPRTIAAETLSEDVIAAVWLKGRQMGFEQTVAMARKWGNEQNIIPAPIDIDFVHEMK
jgi:NAD(P)-dependent dehydrogenase (short-subunit alcohol dehydrogenase family)